VQIRVYYEDTDAGGIVYHTNYIKFCERARSEIFFSKGLCPFEEERSGFVVHNLHADFLATSKLGDLVEVKTSVIKISRSSVMLLQEIFKEEVKIFSMKVTLVYLAEGKPARIPALFKEIFQKI